MIKKITSFISNSNQSIKMSVRSCLINRMISDFRRILDGLILQIKSHYHSMICFQIWYFLIFQQMHTFEFSFITLQEEGPLNRNFSSPFMCFNVLNTRIRYSGHLFQSIYCLIIILLVEKILTNPQSHTFLHQETRAVIHMFFWLNFSLLSTSLISYHCYGNLNEY